MIYSLTFLESAQKEWNKLSPDIRHIFKTKLIQVLKNPHSPKNKLSGLENCYKIKLLSSGYRLVYRVFDDRIVVQIVAIGKRDKKKVYFKASGRI